MICGPPTEACAVRDRLRASDFVTGRLAEISCAASSATAAVSFPARSG